MAPEDNFFPSSGIFDNHQRGTVSDFLRHKIRPGSKLSVVSAFFTIYAYHHLKDKLDEVDELNFLFGEPRFIQPNKFDPQKADPKSFKIEDEGIALSNQLQQKKIASECAAWIKKKVNVRSLIKPNFLHGKVYHILNRGVHEALIGSSNFTVKGLGLDDRPNMELNLEVDSNRDRKDLYNWFYELWNNMELVEDVNERVLQYLNQLYRDNAPEFIYYKTLYHLFQKFLEEQSESSILTEQHLLTETEIWKALFQFQKDAVKGAINKIQKHNGCIIADSVGLGKTYEALGIIKYFELRNHRVLVLCPKKLKENWTVYQAYAANKLNPFPNDRFSYAVLCHTDLSRDRGKSGDIDLSTLNWGAFDLVVIDESHNFRNNTRGRRDEERNVIHKSRYERLMQDIIQSGVKTKVLMLSATPVNNDLSDLRNQYYFITEGNDRAFAESLEIRSIERTLAVAQRRFNEWTDPKKNPTRDVSQLLENLNSAFFKLLDELTIARSRKHILNYYQTEMDKIGHFPERLKPVNVMPDIAPPGEFMTYDQLNDEISNYKLSLFNPSKYVKEEFKEFYREKSKTEKVVSFTQEARENFLIGMMKVNFLKRLESSVNSFSITLQRTIDKIENLETRIHRFKEFQKENPDIDFDDLQVEDFDDEELRDALQVGKKLTFNLAHIDTDGWLKDLEEDRKQLTKIYERAGRIDADKDRKLHELKSLIEYKINNAKTNTLGKLNKKIVAFTAFADTAKYLYHELKDWAVNHLKLHIAFVSGGNSDNKTTLGKSNFYEILTNFSPVSKNRSRMSSMPQEEEIDILIATDCVSEGQNLQDCDYLINYDIHWNPVRIIQRFGRIDRIGSINKSVQLVNFWPTKDLEKYINLKNRVEARMALVDITATGDEKILDHQKLIENELSYRDRQLLQLKEEILDLEDFNENVTLSEFTLDDFRIELTNYIEQNRELLEELPLGLFAVVPSPVGEYTNSDDYPHLDEKVKRVIAPGIIFCLKQKAATDGLEQVNPMQPYFLVYIREDGVVRYNFTHPKQILEIYRLLCSGKESPYEKLCRLFDSDTDNGNDMSEYSGLLNETVKAIISKFRKRSVDHLLSGRAAKIADKAKQVRESSDFDLITWLIIK